MPQVIAYEEFASRTDQTFVVHLENEQREVTLFKVTPKKKNGPFESFSLFFTYRHDGTYFVQKTYPISHPELGSFEMFMVPIQRPPEISEEFVYYQVAYNRYPQESDSGTTD